MTKGRRVARSCTVMSAEASLVATAGYACCLQEAYPEYPTYLKHCAVHCNRNGLERIYLISLFEEDVNAFLYVMWRSRLLDALLHRVCM